MSASIRNRQTGSAPWRRWWVGSAAILLVLALTTSLLITAAWERAIERDRAHAFKAEATGVGSAVATSIQRLRDLTGAMGAMYKQKPQLTYEDFRDWVDAVGVAQRYPGVMQVGVTANVQPSDLSPYLREVHAHHMPGSKLPDPSKLGAPPYCLGQAGVFIDPAVKAYASVGAQNMCRSPMTAGLYNRARDSGQPVVFSFQDPVTHYSELAIQAPVYSTQIVPGTLKGRRANLLGWMGGLFNAGGILAEALQGHPRVGAVLARTETTDAAAASASASQIGVMPSTLVATFGPVHRAGLLKDQITFNSDGAWALTLYGRPPGGVSPGMQALVLLVGCLLLTGLVFTLLFVLGRGRQRALRLVDAKTDELRYQALHDALTGLPNRTLVMDRAEQLLSRARRDSAMPAALFIDLDGFKRINDTLGHGAGDELLRSVAGRLQAAVRDGDTIGRLGGDEFVVLVENRDSSSRAELVAQRILDVLSGPFLLPPSEGTYTITASIGVAEGARETADDLLRDADIALYEAKNSGRDRYVVFAPEMHEAVHDRAALERDLRSALANDELFLVYQPTVDLNGLGVNGVEALVRWKHPERGLLLPATFITIAEDSGLIEDIGRFVLDRACMQGAAWHAEGYAVSMSVNVSGRQLGSETLRDDVILALQVTGLDPACLVLEITETVLMTDPQAAAETLRRIKSLGVR